MTPTTTELAEAAEQFLDQAMALCAEYDDTVRAAVRAAAEAPLPVDVARDLYTSILTQLAEAGGQDPADVADDIASQVEELVLADETEETSQTSAIRLVGRNGLEPREVVPLPTFLGHTVPLREGYVDVNALGLWVENDRVLLSVMEFEDRNRREPSPDDMLSIMTGHTLLPSLEKDDPFAIKALADSIARRGVERPPILAADGTLLDGNRRIAACKYILDHPDRYDDVARERARWVRVWQAPVATGDQVEAIVVALNFEMDHKQSWAEYIKARKVHAEYDRRLTAVRGSLSDAQKRKIRKEVAERFSIKAGEVTRYVKMVRWAEDFEDYHESQGQDSHTARYRANDIFQWFYEIDAGRGGEKLTSQIEGGNDELRGVVYDLMWDAIDSGRLVRGLHKVIAEDGGLETLEEARDLLDSDKEEAARRVQEAVNEAELNRRKRLGLKQHVRAVRAAIDKLGSTAPDRWREFDLSELRDLEFTFESALGSIRAEIKRQTDSDTTT